MEIFSSREIASIGWLLVFCVWGLTHADVRRSVLQFLLAVARLYVLPATVTLYAVGFSYGLNRLGWLDAGILKDTLLWLVATGFVLLGNVITASADDSYFASAIADALRLTLLFEFIVNLHSFSLTTEIILVPIATLLIAGQELAKTKEELAPVKTLCTALVSLLGLAIVITSVVSIFRGPEQYLSWTLLRDFALPIALTVAYLPFVYVFGLYAVYHDLFGRIRFLSTDRSVARRACRRSLLLCGFRLRRVRQLLSGLKWAPITTETDLHRAYLMRS